MEIAGRRRQVRFRCSDGHDALRNSGRPHGRARRARILPCSSPSSPLTGARVELCNLALLVGVVSHAGARRRQSSSIFAVVAFHARAQWASDLFRSDFAVGMEP